MNTSNEICCGDFCKTPLFTIKKNTVDDDTEKIDDNVNKTDDFVEPTSDIIQYDNLQYNDDTNNITEEDTSVNDEENECDECEEENECDECEEENECDECDDDNECEEENESPCLYKQLTNASGVTFEFSNGIGKSGLHIPETIRIEHSFDNCLIMAIASLAINCILITVMWNIS